MDDTELVRGLIFDKKASHAAGGPSRIENAKIAVIQFQISPPKTDIEQSVIVSDYAQMDRILREERNYILGMKSILCDAVTELSLHYLAKAKILVVKDVERDEIEFITKTLNCLPIANIEHFREDKLGYADAGDGKIVKITGIRDMGRTATVLVRGSNQLVIDEADRSLHDALCVIRPAFLGQFEYGDFCEVLLVFFCYVASTYTVGATSGKNSYVPFDHYIYAVVHTQGTTGSIGSLGYDVSSSSKMARSRMCLVNKRFLIAGGGAPEIEMSMQLAAWSKELHGMESYCIKEFADALEVIPYTLAENAGLNPGQSPLLPN
ncbi:T-complex protein 1 subunit delta [Triticum urartu]|uniref:T-complex protein 1 subunit delta n=1 Tax=Triticum urartu TaxID=4572 RepID=M7XLW8_TRIUA|nr:T-complex protein 1 subunit delta [Triticum urartu]